MTLSTLEKRGLAAIIDDAIELLRPEFDGVVRNGGSCRACPAQGFGVPEPHARDCHGVHVLTELRAAKLVLKRPSPVDPVEVEDDV